MPFTLAHPAAVLPFKRICPIYLSFPALVAGSMAPDVPYFFWQWRVGGYAHTLPGIFLLSVPISLVLIWLFKFLCPTAASILPSKHAQFVNSWFADPANKSVKRAALVLLSILLGILTHIAWDSFTHRNGFSVNELPVLNSEVVQVGSYHVHLYKILQHGGTLVGLWVLLLAYALNFQRFRSQSDTHPQPLQMPAATRIALLSIPLIAATAITIRRFTADTADVLLIKFVMYNVDVFALLILLITVFAKRSKHS